jgi:hypothetical protein
MNCCWVTVELGLKGGGTVRGVGAHDNEFLVGELAGLAKDGIGNADVTDGVQGAGEDEVLTKLVVDDGGVVGVAAEGFAEQLAVGFDAVEVLAGVVVAGLGELGKGEDSGVLGLEDLGECALTSTWRFQLCCSRPA